MPAILTPNIATTSTDPSLAAMVEDKENNINNNSNAIESPDQLMKLENFTYSANDSILQQEQE